jgi:pimeloyl-ACP methyl ester carboxylesterase
MPNHVSATTLQDSGQNISLNLANNEVRVIMVAKTKKSNWYINNESNTVFVFIHGFFSDSEKCWTSSDGTFWPDLICQDKRLGGPSIFMASYYTDIDSKNYKISDCADEVLAELRRPGINGEAAVLDKENIVFICHSLGGIVARYMIERSRERFVNKAVGLILMASPSYGSDYANKFSKLIKFYKNGIAAQLQYANGSLQDLDDRFRNLVHQRTIPKLVGAEAIEHHFLFHWKFLPGFAPVVGKDSASRYFGAGKILANTNHSTCVKPDSHDHVSHKFLASFYIDFFFPVAFPAASLTKSSTQVKKRVPNPLFEIYDAVDEPFYLERQVDIDLMKKTQLFSVWLFGNSGMGKTACTRRKFFQDASSPVQVYIGALSGPKIDHIALLKEIYYTVCGIVGEDFEDLISPHKIIEKIGSMLVSYCVQPGIILVIDEIPLMDEPIIELTLFLRSIVSLISVVKRHTGVSHVCVILNSIFDPTQYITDPEMKIGEQIKFLACEEWKQEEIIGLVQIIAQNVGVDVSNEETKELVQQAGGSPRYVKTYFKDILSNSTSTEADVG